MTKLVFTTLIASNLTSVFDLARSVELHLESTSQTDEKAIAGTTSGLMELGQAVTWRAKHFGVYLTHESKITQMKKPTHFVDEMISGRFKSFKHEHFFEQNGEFTLMTDVIFYQTPFGILGKLFDNLLLKNHLENLIRTRNLMIKNAAESVRIMGVS